MYLAKERSPNELVYSPPRPSPGVIINTTPEKYPVPTSIAPAPPVSSGSSQPVNMASTGSGGGALSGIADLFGGGSGGFFADGTHTDTAVSPDQPVSTNSNGALLVIAAAAAWFFFRR